MLPLQIAHEIPRSKAAQSIIRSSCVPPLANAPKKFNERLRTSAFCPMAKPTPLRTCTSPAKPLPLSSTRALMNRASVAMPVKVKSRLRAALATQVPCPATSSPVLPGSLGTKFDSAIIRGLPRLSLPVSDGMRVVNAAVDDGHADTGAVAKKRARDVAVYGGNGVVDGERARGVRSHHQEQKGEIERRFISCPRRIGISAPRVACVLAVEKAWSAGNGSWA